MPTLSSMAKPSKGSTFSIEAKPSSPSHFSSPTKSITDSKDGKVKKENSGLSCSPRSNRSSLSPISRYSFRSKSPHLTNSVQSSLIQRSHSQPLQLSIKRLRLSKKDNSIKALVEDHSDADQMTHATYWLNSSGLSGRTGEVALRTYLTDSEEQVWLAKKLAEEFGWKNSSPMTTVKTSDLFNVNVQGVNRSQKHVPMSEITHDNIHNATTTIELPSGSNVQVVESPRGDRILRISGSDFKNLTASRVSPSLTTRSSSPKATSVTGLSKKRSKMSISNSSPLVIGFHQASGTDNEESAAESRQTGSSRSPVRKSARRTKRSKRSPVNTRSESTPVVQLRKTMAETRLSDTRNSNSKSPRGLSKKSGFIDNNTPLKTPSRFCRQQ